MIADLDTLASEIHVIAREKGFWDHEVFVVRDPVLGDVEGSTRNVSIAAEKIALMHSELSEALEDLRDGNEEHLGEELADVVIRVLDFAAWKGISLDAQITRKVEINADRPRLHGRKW